MGVIMKEHYNTGATTPFDLFESLETSGSPLVDFLRMDIIKRAFRLTVKSGEPKDIQLDVQKIIDEAISISSYYDKKE